MPPTNRTYNQSFLRTGKICLDNVACTCVWSMLSLPSIQFIYCKFVCNFFTGNYSCLKVGLIFNRDRAFYFTTVFIPDIILVTSSFITFWLEWNAVPARVMLGVTTMLNFFTTRWTIHFLLILCHMLHDYCSWLMFGVIDLFLIFISLLVW